MTDGYQDLALPAPEADPVLRAPTDILSKLPSVDSPTWWASVFFDAVGCGDPLQKAEEWLVGDYQGLSKAADAVYELGGWFVACADRVDDERYGMATLWTGESATNAFSYLNSLAWGLRESGESCLDNGKLLKELAVYLESTAHEIVALFSEIIDYCVIAWTSPALARLIAKTPVTIGIGIAAMVAAASYYVNKAKGTWDRITTLWDYYQQAMELVDHLNLVGNVTALVLSSNQADGNDAEVPDMPMPTGPLDNPIVA